MPKRPSPTPAGDPQARADFSTLEVARQLGLAVRSVQLMVDRGELEAWKTPGGHRRISRASVEALVAKRGGGMRPAPQAPEARSAAPKVLLIEDSVHYQNLVSLLLSQQFPEVALKVAPDGIVGLALYGQWQPDVLLVDILLPGIDGATMITSMRSQAQFARSRLVVITSLDEEQRKPYAFALAGLPIVHKPRLALELPRLLSEALSSLSPP